MIIPVKVVPLVQADLALGLRLSNNADILHLKVEMKASFGPDTMSGAGGVDIRCGSEWLV